ncbi:unnamed protein product [Adineta ricciae]|uniref:Ferric-chelate reductase 1 n=1 Tax=Adineta ricciae TaxID=249248 RepID=A0A815A977_ADIRI|nr:unnamed protein product [Adineta ricciae]CAF1415033.1 unnamed protein product [Adineta ricciae]
MPSFVFHFVVFALISIKYGYNYPTGAPNYACQTMTPGHGYASQACSSNYTIQSDKLQYDVNDVVRLTVNSSASFKGVLLVAKAATTGDIVGTWAVVSSTTRIVNCSTVPNTGITHNSRDLKSSVEALWYPPSTTTNTSTIIQVTIVESYSNIYVSCYNLTLTPRQTNTTASMNSTSATVASTTTVTTTATSTETVTTTKSISSVQISWTYNDGVTIVRMRMNDLKTSQWFALGLSLDQNMGEDHVFMCRHLADGSVLLDRRINPSGHSPPVSASTISNPGGTFNVTLQKVEDGTTYCEFTLSNFVTSGRRRRDIVSLSQATPYYPLIAMGDLDSSNEIMQHKSREALTQTVQLNREETIMSNLDSDDSGKKVLMKAHGIIMIFTWILFVSTGILLPRYFKAAWPGTKVCGKPIWFTVHRALMTSVPILTLIAFILILVYENGRWISRNEKREFAHSIAGIIVVVFSVIQPFMALYRCKPDAHYRFIFNHIHRIVGFIALILSIVAMFLVMFFTQFSFEKNKIWGILIAWICWLPIIFFLFWLIEYCSKNKPSAETKTTGFYDITTENTNTPDDTYNKAQIKIDRIKGILLFIHIIVALVLALTLAIFVGKTD